jgi:fructosamine-3-kinase
MADWDSIAASIGTATSQAFQLYKHTAIGGGWINQTYRISDRDGRHYFVKLNAADQLTMFSAEVAGLNEIAATQTIRVPRPIAYGIASSQAFLVLEYLELGGNGNSALLGEQLAAMHRCSSRQFGCANDNFIGSTPQLNGWSDDWVGFWRELRLKYQLQLASKNGYGDLLDNLGNKLLGALPAYFEGYSPQPSLLHGDLWGGNHSYLPDGTPVIFDPAIYYGDRECDLAMTELFGGYNPEFYTAYRTAFPLHEGYTLRRDLYNVYHILNHANMFGGGYVRQAEGMMRRQLAILR